jgi:endoglycosylceramidase
MRYFHGVNVVHKQYPWHPEVSRFSPRNSFTVEDADILSDLNINSIRLAVYWAALEPERGVYNHTYLDVIESIVTTCQQKGIYVLLEFHQDVLASQFCGQGAPLWLPKAEWTPSWKRFPAPQKKPFQVSASGVPSAEQCNSIGWELSK